MCKHTTPRASTTDHGLQQIDELERAIVLAKEQVWQLNGVSAEEIARQRPSVVLLAKAVADQLRSEFLARTLKP
jgi:hypothetical protein